MGTLDELAGWLGHAHYLERRCYEILGSWVAPTPEPQAKAVLAEQCYHHAWHAEVWARRFPAGYGRDLDSAARPASAGLAAALDQLASAPGTVERLAGFFRVLQPRKIVVYDRLRRTSSDVSDRPVLRWLDVVVTDEVEDWRRGEALVQALLRDEAAPEALAWQADLEAHFVAAGELM
ncbi:MAG: hypothetical protein GEV08_18025 [Acidimicrobiia bacterium]|nr:hypothetical protein [Acidimicrobiia bacterium]